MEPVPIIIKSVFHIYGVSCAILSFVLAIMVAQASECQVSTPQLYDLDLVAAVVGVATTGIMGTREKEIKRTEIVYIYICVCVCFVIEFLISHPQIIILSLSILFSCSDCGRLFCVLALGLVHLIKP